MPRTIGQNRVRQKPTPALTTGWEPRATVALLLMFLSGFSALVYQILWIKQLSLVVGIDVHAITIAVSAFFAGLALGGYVFGRWADRSRRPLALYGLVELGVAVLAVSATIVLAHGAPWFATLEQRAALLAWVLPFALVCVPATLMGGTLPVMVRSLTRAAGPISAAGGRLYAANTAGAIAGVVVSSFVLIPALGIRNSALVAGLVNIVGAGIALVLTRPLPELSDEPSVRAQHTTKTRLALILYACAGGIALGYEVVWSQVVVQWTSTRAFAFALVLATYLTGLTIGSVWYARRADRVSDPWGYFGFLTVAAGVVAMLEMLVLGAWLQPVQVSAATLAFHATGVEGAAMAARFVVAAACVVLIPTFLLGAAFPAALRLVADGRTAGGDSGMVLAVNTAGGIVGTMLTGFIVLPALGLERSLAVLGVAAAVVACVAVWRGPAVRTHLHRLTVAAAAVAVVLMLVTSPDHLAQLLAATHKGDLIFHETGAGGTVAVLEQGNPANRFRRLYIQGVSNTGDSLASLRYMRLQAILPLLIHRGEPRSALVIGLGTGITAGSLLCVDTLEKRVCAELLPQVEHAAPLFTGNLSVTTDGRVDIRLRDGRRELLRSAETYDLITLEPPPPSAAGVVNLYSRDFYALAATRLQPDGLLAQWLPLTTQNDQDTRSLVRSFLEVFPHATLWTTELHEMLLIGSAAPIELDAKKITARFSQAKVAAALQEVGVSSPAALLATFVADRTRLEKYADTAAPVTDDRPRIEYGPWVLPGDFEKTLPQLLDLQTEPPISDGDVQLRAATAEQRETLHAFYAAALYAYEGNRAKWQENLSLVFRKDPNNPYFHSFASR